MLLNHFYADYKNVNRHATLHIVFCHLNNDEKQELNEKESSEHTVKWIPKSDLRNFLSVNNNLFVVDILEKGTHAYEGDGLMVNSNELNGLTPKAARKKIIGLFI